MNAEIFWFSDFLKEEKDLRDWFKEKWVDVSRKDKDGKPPPCGRDDADKSKRGYPKCRPSKKVSEKTPKTAGSMSVKEKKAATNRKRSKKQGVGGKPTMVKSFDSAWDIVKDDSCWDGYKKVGMKTKNGKKVPNCVPSSVEKSVCECDICDTLVKALLTKGKKEKPFHGYNPNKHSRKGGLNAKGRAKFKREQGSNLKPPVTQKPSTLKPGSKKAKRRKSFCARMSGVKGPTSKGGKKTPKGAALARWNC